MWKPLEMVPAPAGYRVAVFALYEDAFLPAGQSPRPDHLGVQVCPVVALVLAEYERDDDTREDEPGTRRLTFAYAAPGDYGTCTLGGDFNGDVQLYANRHANRAAVQLLAPGEEPDMEVGAQEMGDIRHALAVRRGTFPLRQTP